MNVVPKDIIESADKSDVQSHLERMNVLRKFKELSSKNLRFKRKRDEDSEEEIEGEDKVRVVYTLQPPPRKRPCT